MPRRRSQRALASVLVLAGAAGLGFGGPAPRPDPGWAADQTIDEPPSRRSVFGSAPLLTCGAGEGGLPLRPRALRNRRGYERRRNPAARALRAFLREAADEPRRGWFLLARGRRSLEFANGRLPEVGVRGRILSPLVHYGRTAVTVTYFTRPLGPGAYTCQGVPSTPATLGLDEPLGNRRLRDGGTFPPTRR